MKFRMFTDATTDRKIAVNIDYVRVINVGGRYNDATEIWLGECDENFDGVPGGDMILVKEDFDTVLSRLNTIAK